MMYQAQKAYLRHLDGLEYILTPLRPYTQRRKTLI